MNRRSTSSFRCAGLLLLAVSASAGAQVVVPERELELTKALYDHGKYEEALQRATDALAATNFSEAQRVKVLELIGLCAFNLGQQEKAQAHFLQLLKLDPDYNLDPFAVPPPAMRLFEQVRREAAGDLALVRQRLALRLEQEKRALAERERLAAEQEERRRRIEELTRVVTVRTVERKSYLLNLLPFGAGQFQQGRTRAGTLFAVSEGVLGAASVIAYFAIQFLFEDIRYRWTDRITPDNSGMFPQVDKQPTDLVLRRIPASRRTQADVWRVIKYGAGIGFYLTWAAGALEALWHHRDEVVSETRVPPPPPGPASGSTPTSPSTSAQEPAPPPTPNSRPQPPAAQPGALPREPTP